MREILGKRRTNGDGDGDDRGLLDAALEITRRWGWPVVPGIGTAPGGRCRCPRGDDCVVPGAHPSDPPLLAATRDERMVEWWWRGRPHTPIVLATGGRAPCALSVPAAAGAWALAELDRLGAAPGPVLATPTRYALLVEPYELAELGELLSDRGGVPGSLRFHGPGGYLPLPPSAVGGRRLRWVSPPRPHRGRVVLPPAVRLLDVLVEAGATVPEQGSRLAY
ncbi:bifunctional DNA primase/polymerase [Streptomyces sp. 7-21]|uniref:bifunctional DNA primase/polymerase n=1 Tax=Streptomyces sp. 7-21 TaxID=2802283 RepID=UPI00191CC999|nr:bifunctional DNA primase/polymerase [Streptomyces sp. 7-21]MBL1067950.1 bifunctional DNA primase/polymerase [Streptomyces sp. 7-21]